MAPLPSVHATGADAMATQPTPLAASSPGGGAELQPLLLPAGKPALVRAQLLCAQPQAIVIFSVEHVPPPPSCVPERCTFASTAKLFCAERDPPNDAGADNANDDEFADASGAAVLRARDSLSVAFSVKCAQPCPAAETGTLRVCWARLEDVRAATSVFFSAADTRAGDRALASALATTVLPCPCVRVDVPPFAVTVEAPAQATLGEPFPLAWSLRNDTRAHASLRLSMPANSSAESIAVSSGDTTAETSAHTPFLITGQCDGDLHLAPGEHVRLDYTVVPLACGHLTLPPAPFEHAPVACSPRVFVSP